MELEGISQHYSSDNFIDSSYVNSISPLFLLFPIKLHSQFFLIFIFRASTEANGNSEDRGLIRAAAASLPRSHSNLRPKMHLQPTTYTTAQAMQDPYPTEQGQGSNPHSRGYWLGS